jgi:glyoxylase-like metal-dependent hydrolase (beta-lactamase superfamily II)
MTWDVFTGGFCQTNAYLLHAGGRRLLVDAPDDCAEWLRGLGVKVDALLLTHQHFDHVMDAARIVADHGCPVVAWTQPTTDLWLNRMFSQMTGWELEIAPYVVTQELGGAGHGDGDTVTLAGESFQILHVPGHSPDSVCFYHASSGHCFCGDTVFAQGVGRTDFPGGSADQLLAGIREKIFALPGETVLLPGHGGITTVADEKAGNPFLAD